jgi:hypothetical protein
MRVKTNLISFLCENRRGHHDTELQLQTLNETVQRLE